MQALVKTQKGEGFIELQDVPEPVNSDDEVLIEVKAAGICGTDIHVKHDTFPYWPPVILGHEFSGEIVKVGDNVTGWQVGDRVVGEPHTLHCGTCYLCREGHIQNCAQKRSPGWGIDGAFTKYLKYPPKLLHHIPDGMTFEQAALVEPAANCVTDIVERGSLEVGDFVVVTGPGPIGLIAAQVAKAGGAREVMIVGAPGDEELRLSTARKLGIDHVVNFAEENPVEKCLALTDGRGADLVIELTKVLTLYFSMSTAYASWDKTIWMIAEGKVNADLLVTHTLPLAEWEKAFEAVESMEALKVVLIP